MNTFDRDLAIMVPTYSRLPLEIDKGEGCYLVDKEGKRYLDLFGGLAVNALGYAHPDIVAAVEGQIRKHGHISNLFAQDAQVELAELLSKESDGKRVFFCNTGAEATESAIKLARKWGSQHGKNTLVGFTGGFHGRTTGALAIMANEKYRAGFGPFIEGCRHLEFNNPEDLERGIDASTAAVFIEPIQGEGGVVPATEEFIDTLVRLRAKFGFLIVSDEIQTGIGRTGTFWGYERFGFQPDLITAAKAIGGGLPLGVLLVGDSLKDVYGLGNHGTTFGGNPVACAAGIAVMQTLQQERLIDNARSVGEVFREGFLQLKERYPNHIVDVRGAGLMIGVELAEPIENLREQFLSRGVLINITHQRVIRLLPPLILSEQQAREALDTFTHIFAQVFS